MAAPHPLTIPEEGGSLHAFLAAEGVPKGARLLDVPCGIGRRALVLAEHGYDVTAVDSNEVAVEAARTRVPPSAALRLRYLSRGKEALPGLGSDERFDAILCMDHALGRGPPEEDAAFLRRLRAHVADAGLLVVDFLHRDFFAARPRPFAFHVLGHVEQHEFRSFDPLTGILGLRWKFYERQGLDLRHRMDSSASLRLLTPHEASALLEGAGWRVVAAYGGYDRGRVGADRRKLVLVARPHGLK